jgi:hypothetical protein
LREADLEWRVIDSTIVPAHQHAAGARKIRWASQATSSPVGAQPVADRETGVGWIDARIDLARGHQSATSGPARKGSRVRVRGRALRASFTVCELTRQQRAFEAQCRNVSRTRPTARSNARGIGKSRRHARARSPAAWLSVVEADGLELAFWRTTSPSFGLLYKGITIGSTAKYDVVYGHDDTRCLGCF